METVRSTLLGAMRDRLPWWLNWAVDHPAVILPLVLAVALLA